MSSAASVDWYVDPDDEPVGPAVWASPVVALHGRGAVAVDHDLVTALRRQLAERLAERLTAHPVADPAARRELARTLLGDLLADRSLRLASAGLPTPSVEEELAVADGVLAALFGLGRLQPLVDDPEIENIEVNGFDQVWLAYRDGRVERGPAIAASDDELIELVQSLGARSGSAERTFSTVKPSLHLRLDDGSRLAAIAWVTPRPQIVIRRHRVSDIDLPGLVRLGTIDTALEAFLRAAMRAGRNIVVTGLQNSGKTTTLRALASEFPPEERFATIEREYELHLHELTHRHPRVVAMEAREGSAERAAGGNGGEVTLSELVVDALRMNVRRIIVGEVRGSEVLPMLEAMSTGDGSLCTLHARSAHHAFDRLVTLCLSSGAGMSDTFAYRLAAGAVDLVVHIQLDDGPAGRRRYVSEVVEVGGIGDFGRPVMTAVFRPGIDGRAVPAHRPACLPELVRAGFDAGFLDQPRGTWEEVAAWQR